MNYFELFKLPQAFALDLAQLEQAYFDIQRQHHPDRASQSERLQAVQQSADINQAYHTLKNPLTRARYILYLNGIEVGGEHDTIKPSQALLMETLEWREAAETADAPALAQLDAQLAALQERIKTDIAGFCEQSDWDHMAAATLRFGYALKSREEIARRLKLLRVKA